MSESHHLAPALMTWMCNGEGVVTQPREGSAAVRVQGSTGSPAALQAAKPPRMGVTLLKPFSSSLNAKLALSSSCGQVQYVMIHSALSSTPNCDGPEAKKMLMAPGMCANS